MKRVLVDCTAHQVKVGVLEDGELVEYWIENKENQSIDKNISANEGK